MKWAEEFAMTSPRCAECEARLADAVDGSLTGPEQARFDEHVSTCGRCSEMLDEAKRGSVWLAMLRTPRPEPSGALLERIFAETSGAEGSYEWTAPAMVPAGPAIGGGAVVLPFRSRVVMRHAAFQPRLAMTAAMAFFSVALTLNLTGVRLNEVHASDLGPAGLRRAAYDTEARAARYYGNLKVVYVLESRLEDLRKSREDERSGPYQPTVTPRATPEAVPEKPAKREAPGPGASRVESVPRVEMASVMRGENGSMRREAVND